MLSLNYLKFFSRFRRQLAEVDPSRKKDVRRFWNPVNFPAQILEEGRQPRLPGRLATAGPTGQHQFPHDFAVLGNKNAID